MSSADPSPTERAKPDTSPGSPARPGTSHRSSTGYLGALWITAPLMPGLVAVVTVATYLSLTPTPWTNTSAPDQPGWAIIVGLVALAVVWLGGGIPARVLVSAPRAQLRLYADLLERSRTLRDRVACVDTKSAEAQRCLEEARTQLDYVDEELAGEGKGPALRWALASGYMSVIRSMHRAEEALIMAESTDAVVGDALHDALSLEGSAIGNRERLLGILRVAVDRVSPASATLLAVGTGRRTAADEALDVREARQALREVRYAINEYRDDRHGGLVRARNRLLWTMLAVGVATYLLLAVALAAAVPVPYILAVAVFYLVGAIVGLFNRLRIEAGQTSAVEDFGLSQARLVVTPLVSGLAAVAGVYLVAIAPTLFPSATTAGTAPPPAPSLTEVFDLTTNSIGLVYAAIFGLAPGTLTSRLAAASTRLERDIQSTDAASGGTAPSEGGG